MELIKNDTHELIYKTETDWQISKTHGCQRGNVGQGLNQELGMSIHTALYTQ